MMWKECVVKTRENGERVDKEAILVGVFQQSDVIPPSMMVGGHAGGQVGGPVAVVKMDDKLQRVQIQDVIVKPDTYDIVGNALVDKLQREWAEQSMKEYISKEREKWMPKHELIGRTFTYPVDTVGMIHTYLKNQEAAEPKPAYMDNDLYRYAVENDIPLTKEVSDHLLKPKRYVSPKPEYHVDVEKLRKIQEEDKAYRSRAHHIVVHDTGLPNFNDAMKIQLNQSSGIVKSKGGLQ